MNSTDKKRVDRLLRNQAIRLNTKSEVAHLRQCARDMNLRIHATWIGTEYEIEAAGWFI